MPTRKLVIAIDCDDVLIPTAEGIIDYYNDRYETNLRLDHFYAPVTQEAWGTEDKDVAIERVNDFLRSQEHAATIPHAEAIHAVRTLAKHHELHLVTGRVDFLKPVTTRMLEDHFQGCFRSVEHTNYMIPSSSKAVKRTKGEVCRALGADLLIDDHLEHAKNALETALDKAIVFGEYPWNRHSKALPAGMVRCRDWAATVEEIDKSACR